ncbi:hypothetical protein OVA13_10030 [Pseudoxanthomonas sp. SL93]|uniref:hypothetical protein n=1 Tax=Pseudoxanthomonas sp. SL93 TaxID=2995142 RepID=UPI002271F521|nr:hypothetical protein [Pseudoxanthomonas sp. SL93]WAC61756.1 hypothetical protein OVA13_10030 [Pseudoxanthomonas sp. SL93]
MIEGSSCPMAIPVIARRAEWLLLALLLVTAALYWPGLSGPFMLDDRSNFVPLQAWLTGERSWWEVVLGNQSGVLGRSLSMASFTFSLWWGGGDAFHFKVVNLALHLACGCLVHAITRRLVAGDVRWRDLSRPIALVVTAIWLLHPLHVSTVLYAAQRVALQGALFTLICIWLYQLAGQQWHDGRRAHARVNLFLIFPLSLLAGSLSKESAAIAPALCLVLELSRGETLRTLAAPKRAFFLLFLAVPGCLVIALLVIKPALLLADYSTYDFTLQQRILTELRILVDYLGQLLLPRTPVMGLYYDDFTISTGWLSPSSTLISALVLAAISGVAIGLRRTIPGLFAGWFFFLVAHGVESTFLPLDLYFEHRNYLPSVGLFIACACVLVYLGRRLPSNAALVRRWSNIAVICLSVALGFATLGRVMVWSHYQSIVDTALIHHPDSLRARLDEATLALKSNDLARHDAALAALMSHEKTRHRLIGHAFWLTTQCTRGAGNSAELERMLENAVPQVTLSEVGAFKILGGASRNGGCGPDVTDSDIAKVIDTLLARATTQPDSAKTKWLLRFQAAQLYARAGHLQDALTQAKLAWQPRSDPGVGAFLAQLYQRAGMQREAIEAMRATASRIRCQDASGRREFVELWAAMNPGTPLPPLRCAERRVPAN